MMEKGPTCQELIEFLMDYLDGELAPRVHEHFDQHLAICRDCRSYLDSYQETVKMAVAVCEEGDGGLPDDVPEDLVEAILKAKAPRPGS